MDEIMKMECEMLTPEQAAAVIGCNPQSIRIQARENPEKLGFPVCVAGNRVRIPRRAFIQWMGYGNE